MHRSNSLFDLRLGRAFGPHSAPGRALLAGLVSVFSALAGAQDPVPAPPDAGLGKPELVGQDSQAVPAVAAQVPPGAEGVVAIPETKPAAPARRSELRTPPQPQDNPGFAPAQGERGHGGQNRVDYKIQARIDPRPAAPRAAAGSEAADPSAADPSAADSGAAGAPAEAQTPPPAPATEPAASSPGLAAPEREHFVLHGSLELSFQNNTADSLSELWFHLYLNAFANNRSTHLIASGGSLRNTKVADEWGFSELRSIRLLGAVGATDLLPSLSWRWPSVPNPQDRTVFKVDLPEPLAPGGTVRVAIEWDSVLPRVRRRTGTKGDFLFLGQWFPKLGVYEEGRGWNCHPFHAFTEWYADFGNYDVRFDMPADYADKVFGSGVRSNQVEKGDRVLVSFTAPSEEDRREPDALSGRARGVHDFAMAADPDFVPFSKPFRFAEWADRFPQEVERARRAFGADFSPALREVTVEVAIQEERSVQAERHYQAACSALFFYGLWFGEYPFERLTVIDPAYGASEAGGMEYPTLFTAGTRLFTRPSMHSPEGVTIHEAGHQWFQGIVASNEFEAAWLDEGLNTYADSEVLFRVYGEEHATTDYAGVPFDGVQLARFGSGLSGRLLTLEGIPLGGGGWLGMSGPLQLLPRRASGFLDFWREQPLFTLAPRVSDPRQSDRLGYLSSDDVDPVINLPWNARDRNSHYTNTYRRTGTALRSLPVVLAASKDDYDGEAAFLRGMRRYSTLWRFGHPYPEDFFEAFQAGVGPEVDSSPYFADLFRSTARGDWSVAVRQERQGSKRGFFPDAAGHYALAGKGEKGAGNDWQIEVTLARDGELCLPVPLKLTFADGQVQERVWTRAEQEQKTWLRLEFEGPAQLVSAEIDPNRILYIDGDKSNDRWFEASDPYLGWRWSERLFSQLAERLLWQKSLGG